MPIDVTPGSASAVAFGSVAEADAYFAARGITTWTGSETVKEQDLVKGCDYLVRRYAGEWAAERTSQSQSLPFPAVGLYDLDGYPIASDIVPEAIKKANFEAAHQIMKGVDLEPVLTDGDNAVRKRVKAGPVEKETEYQNASEARAIVTAIDGLLKGFIRPSNTVQLLRV